MAGRGQLSLGSGQGQMAGCCEHGDEPEVSMKCVELLQKYSTQWS